MVEEDSIILATWPLGLAEQHHAGQNWQGSAWIVMSGVRKPEG